MSINNGGTPPPRPRTRTRRVGPPLPRSRASTRRRPKRRLTKILLLTVALFSLVGMGATTAVFAGYNGYRGQLPDPATLAGMEPPLDTHVYARDGHTLIAILHGDKFRHEHIRYDQVPALIRQATVDVEDRHFWENAHSYDLPRIAKAGFSDLRGQGGLQGASTITEQLAKISYLPAQDRTIDRKVKQVILGDEIDNNFSRPQILEMYLNRVFYGNYAVGIESAAELYLHKSAAQLDLAEASMLVGLPNSPSDYNPLIHDAAATVNPLAKKRQRIVLNAMATAGDITPAAAVAASLEPLTFYPWWTSEPQVAPDFHDLLVRWLTDHYGVAWQKPGGWEVTTTLDPARQYLAEKSLHDGIAAIYQHYNAHDGALVSMDPRTGEVLAMVGTWDYNDPGVGQLNMALRPLQPGSTIKLFTYTAAIASRQYQMDSPIVDAPVKLDDGSVAGYSPTNYDLQYHGTCTLAQCLGNSFNIPAVKVEQAVGIAQITNLEIAAGLTSLVDPRNRPGPKNYAATLGGLTYGLTPLELVNGASTLAGMGMHHDPTPVLKITDRVSNTTIYAHDANKEARRVLPDNVAYIMNEVTSNDANRMREFGPHGELTLPGRRVSAKTGTTQFFADNWTVGWTPDIATAVWVGNPTPSCLKPADHNALAARIGGEADQPLSPAEVARYGLTPINDHCGHLEGSTGVTGAAPIWHQYMQSVLAPVPPTWFTKPNDVILAGGTGDDGLFLLPGQQGTGLGAAPVAPPAAVPSSGCYYWGIPNPSSTCHYLGPHAPSPSSPPVPAPAPGPPPAPPVPGPPGPPLPGAPLH